jgi:hypothetical protein
MPLLAYVIELPKPSASARASESSTRLCRRPATLALALVVAPALVGCAASHGEDSPAVPSPEPAVIVGPDEVAGVAEVTWHIPESEQPPLLDGAAQVLTSVARGRFNAAVGRFLLGSPRVYEGTLSIDAGALGVMPRTEVTLTSTLFPSLFYRDVTFDQAHVMTLGEASGALRVRAFQETSEAELDPSWLSAEGLGSAWLDVSMSDDHEAFAWGRCFGCMTVLEEAPVARIVLGADALDTDGAPPVAVRVEGELEHVAPELLTPPILERAIRTDSRSAAPVMLDFEERQPGLWQREQADSTYLRCKEGGSRLVDFRTTWTIEEGNLDGSGISAIEVDAAGACEAFDYGGGS